MQASASVGAAIAEASNAARSVSEQHQAQRALDERLGSILSAAHNDGDGQLNRLRTLFASSTKKSGSSDPADTKGKRVVRDVDAANGGHAQEELFWFERTLIWSRLPSTVIRSFSFPTPVTHACWARFELSNVALAEGAEQPPIGPHVLDLHADPRLRRPVMQAIPPARIGGFSLAQNHVRTADQQIRARATHRPSYRKSTRASVEHADTCHSNVQNALCIFLENTLVLYFPDSGDEHQIHLPFRVKLVFPLALGILVQREPETEDFRYHAQQRARLLLSGQNEAKMLGIDADTTDSGMQEDNTFDPALESGDALGASFPVPTPLAYQLCRPFDEFSAFDRFTQVIEPHTSSQNFPLVHMTGPKQRGYLDRTPLRVSKFSDPNFPDLQETIIFVSDANEISPLPLLVTAHYGKRCIRIFQYAVSGISTRSVQSVSALMGFDTHQATPTQSQTAVFTQFETQGTILESQMSQAGHVMMEQHGTAADTHSTTAPLSQPSGARNLGRGRPPPRRSARIEMDRKSSGHPSSSSTATGGGSSAATGAASGSSGSQNHGRPSHRLSRRISSSTHQADLRRVSTRSMVDRTSIAGAVGEELHAGLGMPLDNSQDERGGFAEVMEGINREQAQPASQPVGAGMGRGPSQMRDPSGAQSQPVQSNNPRARSASASQRPSHARRSSHLSMSRVVSGAPGAGNSGGVTLPGGTGASQQRHGSGSSSHVPVAAPGGVSIGGRPPSSRRQPSLGGNGGAGVGGVSIIQPPGAEVTANVAIGGSQFDGHDRSYATAAIIVQQAEAMAHEPGAPIPLPLRPSPGPAHSGEGTSGDNDEDRGLEGAADFARMFGALALLEEIRVDGLDSEDKLQGIRAFVTGTETKPWTGLRGGGGAATSPRSNTTLSSVVLWISIPTSKVLLSRAISEIPLEFQDGAAGAGSADLTMVNAKLGYSLRSSEADEFKAHSFLEAQWAAPVPRGLVSSYSSAGIAAGRSSPPASAPDVVWKTANGALLLVLGDPSKQQPSIALPDPTAGPEERERIVRNATALTQLACPLAGKVLDALDRVLIGKEGSQIRHAVLSARLRQGSTDRQKRASQEWDLLSKVILGGSQTAAETSSGDGAWSRLLRSEAHRRLHATSPFPRGGASPKLDSPAVELPLGAAQRRSRTITLRVLHLLAQEMLASDAHVSDDLRRLTTLVVQLANRLGSSSWAEYWERVVPSMSVRSRQSDASPAEGAHLRIPTLGELLLSSLDPAAQRDAQQNLLDYFIGPARKDGLSSACICPILTRLVNIYRALAKALADATLSPMLRAQIVVDAIVAEGMTRSDIVRLPFGYALPLWEAIRIGQAHPAQWSAQALELVDRVDLMQSREDRAVMAPKYTETQLRTLPSTEALDPLSAVLFGSDFRLDEVVKMFYTSGPLTIDFPERDEKKLDTEVKEEQSRVYWSVTERTKATTVGKGAFLLMSKPFVDTQLWDVPPLCLDLRGEPNALITSWPINKPSDFELEWPEFHNGVAAALSIWAEDGQTFESDWIFSHYGSEPTAKHAGFLFGLGLLGRLKSLGRVHAYRYFAPRHGITTIGIILGLGASFVGTGDPAVRQLMALQIAAFLPDGSAPLNQSMLTQTAGILGMGLTFMGSYHRWTAERLLAQIRVENIQTSDNPMFLRDAYALSSGLALGLVMLGKGRRDPMTGAADRRMIGSLFELIEGPQPVLFDGETSGLSNKDTTITNIPATIALGLIFLRSNRRDVVGQLLRLPTSTDALEYVRPDTLFARALARHMIMWDDVKADADWIESTLPSYLRTPPKKSKRKDGAKGTATRAALQSRDRMRTKLNSFSEPMQLAYLNLYAACCFVIGLKWAGTQDLQAAECLLNEYDILVDTLRPTSTTYFERIRRAALQTAKDLAMLSCSLILAGSGHLSLLTRLRLEHGKIESPPSQSVYGTYLSSHLALGFLFLGGGRYTFGTSDGAIACLLIACFPRFPASSGENRAHLQAYRHLWVLAVEPRLVVAQDVESGVVQSLDAIVGLRKSAEGQPMDPTTQPAAASSSVQLHLPGQAPPFEMLDSIRVESAAFWDSELRISQDREHARRLLLTRRLPVKRRSGFPSLTLSSGSTSFDAAKGSSARRASSGLDGLAADLARLTGNRILSENGSADEGSLTMASALTKKAIAAGQAAERMYSLERRTLSTSLGLEHAATLGQLPGLLDAGEAHTVDESVADLLESYVRDPAQKTWLRLILSGQGDGGDDDAGLQTAGKKSAFQRYALRALISVLVADAPPEVLNQGLLGLFWRATCLSSAAPGKLTGTLARDAGRIAESIHFLHRLYSIKAVGASAGPLLLAGLGLRWSQQHVAAAEHEQDAIVSVDLVEAAARDLRERARRLWDGGDESSEPGPTGAAAFARALLHDGDGAGGVPPREEDEDDWRVLSAIFSGTSTPWVGAVLRPFLARASELARTQLVRGVEAAAVRDMLGRVLDGALLEAGGAAGQWKVEGYVRDAFVTVALEQARA
ncbi:Anaphase-promoting complex subunit 1 [Tilletia horrida]|uniref:Anaphase-promoting complex subunit 1 n=1 Tax=Tilletia horrida TaxID=155126 RepID=A0AAN6GA96_9BASI|nr:Anaphase-promoting complex subunit 1 [Tilletia horrida]